MHFVSAMKNYYHTQNLKNKIASCHIALLWQIVHMEQTGRRMGAVPKSILLILRIYSVSRIYTMKLACVSSKF